MEFNVPILNRLSATSNAFKTQIADWLRKKEAYNRLRMLLASTNEHKKALEYHKSSKWSFQQLKIFVQFTGQLPPEEAKMIPNEILQGLDLATHFDPEYVENMKRSVTDALETLNDNAPNEPTRRGES